MVSESIARLRDVGKEMVLNHMQTYYDIKFMNDRRHQAYTMRSNARILENLKYLDSMGARCEIRIPFIPNYNGEDLDEMAEFLSSLKNIVRVRVLPYHNYAGSKYDALGMWYSAENARVPTDEELALAQSIFDNVNKL